jgi:type II secretion system protein C
LLAKTRQIKAAFWAVDIVLVMATAAFAVGGVMHLRVPALSADGAPAPLIDPTSSQTPGGQSKIRPRSEYQSLAKSDLFGEQSRKSAPQPVTPDIDLPETTLDLELLGIVVETGSAPGYAIIKGGAKSSVETYTVGDTIVNNARVEEIRSDAVVISRAGKRETLSMSFVKKQQEGRRDFSRGRVPPPSPRRRNPIRKSASNEAIRVQNENMRYINRERLLEQAGQNLTALINDFRTRPNIVDGKPSGIGIEQVGSDPISSKAGLKAGDIVKSINGTRVNSMDEILEQGAKLQGKPEVRVVIERDGRHRTLVYKIR